MGGLVAGFENGFAKAELLLFKFIHMGFVGKLFGR
jgi:hypothetical protein